MKFSSFLALLASSSTAQNVTVPNITLPNTCTADFIAGTDTVLVTIPYTYDQVLSIIADFKNLTWTGVSDNSITLNGTDNTVGTARTYSQLGIPLTETLFTYSRPPYPGPYVQVYSAALINDSAANHSFYIPFDSTVVVPICNGAASTLNFTSFFCATDVTALTGLLHTLHVTDALTAAKFLGGRNFTSCTAIVTGGSNASVTRGAIPAQFTRMGKGVFVPMVLVGVVGVLAAMLI